MGTITERATSASVRGQSPSPYVRSVGCSAQAHGPPLPDAVRSATTGGLEYTGRPPYICAQGTPSARTAAANSFPVDASVENHGSPAQPPPTGPARNLPP